jgi:ABC-type glycerol-3-phosphate transport system substrate-binding protein
MKNRVLISKRVFVPAIVLFAMLFLNGCTQQTPVEIQEDKYLRFAVPESTELGYKKLIQDFETENPTVHIDLVLLPASNWIDGDFKEIASSADVFLLRGKDQVLLGKDYLLNLNPLTQSEETFDAYDYWGSSLSSCSDENDNLFGLPSSLEIYGVFLDKEKAEKLNGSAPKYGWTWADFRELVTSLASSNGTVPVFRDYPIFSNPNLPFPNLISPLIDSNIDSGEIDIEKLIEDLNWYVDFSRAHLIIPSINMDDEAQPNIYPDLKTPLWIGAIDTPLFSERGTYAFNQYVFLPFPVSDDSNGIKTTTPVFSTCAVASIGTAQKATAWQLIQFLSRHPVDLDIGDASNGFSIPARQSVTQSTEFWGRIPDEIEETVRFILGHSWYGSKSPKNTFVVNSTIIESTWNDRPLEETLSAISIEVMEPTPRLGLETLVVEPFLPSTRDNFGNQSIKFYTTLTDENTINWSSLVDEFQDLNPEINVTLLFEGNGVPIMNDYAEYLSSNYDCFHWHVDDMLNDMSSQYLTDLTPYLYSEESAFLNDYETSTLELFMYKGNLIGLPASTQLNLMSYNADLLSELGIPEPALDWTFDDFLDMVNTASFAERYYGFLFAPWDVDWFLASQGTKLMGIPDEFEVHINTFATQNSLKVLEDLNQTGRFFFLTGDRQNSFDAQALVSSGKIAFWTSTSGNPGNWYLSQDSSSPFRVGTVPLPITQSPFQQYTTANMGLFISKNSPFPKACWQWIKFLSENPASFDGLPMRRSIRNSSSWESVIGYENAEVYRVAYRQSDFIRYNWDIVGPLHNIFVQALQSIFEGGDIQIELATAQSKADQFLNCISPYVEDFRSYIDQVNIDQCNTQ